MLAQLSHWILIAALGQAPPEAALLKATPADVDAAMIFDHFTAAVLMSLEQYGFCPLGESGPFVEAGETRWPSGRLPVNTHGGSTSESSIHGLHHRGRRALQRTLSQLDATPSTRVARGNLAVAS